MRGPIYDARPGGVCVRAVGRMYMWRALLLLAGVAAVAAVCPKTTCTTLSSCWDHGTCTIAGDGTESCTCDAGWTGSECTTRTCSGATCVNGDCCESGCCCYAGWTGSTCETFVGLATTNMISCRADGYCVCTPGGTSCASVYGQTSQYLTDLAIMPIAKSNVYIDYEDVSACDCRVGTTFYTGSGLRKLLRFPVMTHNAGPSNLFLGTPHSPNFTYTCNNLPEFPAWYRFSLYTYTKVGPVTLADVLAYYANPVGPLPVLGAVTVTLDTLVATGTKSQIVRDSVRVSGEHNFPHFVGSTQGLTRGWMRYTVANMDANTWIDVTNIASGQYLLRLEVNPLQTIAEQSYANNVFDMLLECDVSCGAHGTCNFGTGCACAAGWGGAACDIDLSAASGCVPSCTGKACGYDGCGGLCGACARGFVCDNAVGTCSCTPDCSDRTCGTNGCGGTCGICRKDRTVCKSCYEAGGNCTTAIFSCAAQ